jgi:alkylation response protein AidB-like acyl-CoA dehydrogenase
LGIEIPQKYGGAGMSFFNSIIAIEQMAKTDSAMGGLIDLQNTVVNTLLLHNGSEKHLAEYCPKLAKNMVKK